MVACLAAVPLITVVLQTPQYLRVHPEPGTSHPPLPLATLISTFLSPLNSVPILCLPLHHCSGSASRTEHARRSCSLWMEQSGEEEEEEEEKEKGGGEWTAERESHRSRTQHGEAVAARRTGAA